MQTTLTRVFFFSLFFPFAALYAAVWDGTANTDWYDPGEDEFTLYTPEQLAGFAQLVSGGDDFAGKTVSLGDDILLNDTTGWDGQITPSQLLSEPNADGYYVAPPVWEDADGRGLRRWSSIGYSGTLFQGIFLGKGHSIAGLYGDTTTFGLFHTLGADGVVKNLRLSRLFLRKGDGWAGGIARESAGLIEDCTVEGVVHGAEYAGGLVGFNGEGEIRNSGFVGEVSGEMGVGGIAGYWYLGELSEGTVTAVVTGLSYVGGLIGELDEGTVNGATAEVTVRAGWNAGGVFGIARASEISDVEVTGRLIGKRISGRSVEVLGGLAGGLYGSSLEGGVASVEMTVGYDETTGDPLPLSGEGVEAVGGLIGQFRQVTLIDNRAEGNLRLRGDYVAVSGGAIGWGDAVEISGLRATGAVWAEGESLEGIGGLIGILENDGDNSVVLSGSAATGDLTISGTDEVTRVGGLIGGVTGGGDSMTEVIDSYATGAVEVTSEGEISEVGGLIGGADLNGEEWSDLRASGDVTVRAGSRLGSIGGFIGYLEAGEVQGIVATGAVVVETGDRASLIGGLIGYLYRGKITGEALAEGNFRAVGPSLEWIGGGLGAADDSEVIDLVVSGDVTLEGGEIRSVGGLIGETEEYEGLPFRLENSRMTGNLTVTAAYSAEGIGGGIGGIYTEGSDSVTVRQVDFSGNLEVSSATGYAVQIGGVIGEVEIGSWGGNIRGELTGLIRSGDLSVSAGGGEKIGGLIGRMLNADLRSSMSSGDVTVTVTNNIYDVGGLVGALYSNSSVEQSLATGTLIVTGEAYGIGGVAGYMSRGEILNVVSTVDVTVTGTDISEYVGGLVGLNDGTIGNSYALGSVVGGQYVGGAIGYNNGDLGVLYAAGKVTGDEDVGGLIGYNDGMVALLAYWNSDSTAVGIGNGDTDPVDDGVAEGMTTVQLRSAETAARLRTVADSLNSEGIEPEFLLWTQDLYYSNRGFPGFATPLTLRYFYGGTEDVAKKVEGEGVLWSEVSYDAASMKKPKNGYVIDLAAMESVWLTGDAEANVFDVRYKKGTFKYTIEYYYNGKIDTEATVTDSALFEATVAFNGETMGKAKTGYGLDTKKTTASIKIGTDLSKNVIKVYYAPTSSIGPDFRLAVDLRIFPNPVRESFSVQGLTEEGTLRMVDLRGRTVLLRQVAPGEVIGAEGIAPGSYWVSVGNKTVKLNKQ